MVFWWEPPPPPPDLTRLARIRWSTSQNYFKGSDGNLGVTDKSNRHYSCNAADVLAIINDLNHPLHTFISKCVTLENQALVVSGVSSLYVNIILERPYLQPFIKKNLAVEPDEAPATIAEEIATSLEPAIARMLSLHDSLSQSTLGTVQPVSLSQEPVTYIPATTDQNLSRTARLWTWLDRTEQQATKLKSLWRTLQWIARLFGAPT